MNNGYIALHRKILENPVVCKDAEHYAVWSYLLLTATHKEQKKLFAGKPVTLYPGMLITGRKKIATLFKISESKVQRVLKTLEIEQQIEQLTCNQNRLVTVINWDRYQSSEQQNGQQLNNNRTTGEQQVNTNNNGDKGDKGNNVNNKHTEFFEKAWELYPKKKGHSAVSITKKKELYKIGDELLRAINRYKEEVKDRDIEYIKNGDTFFRTSYVDYLDKNYVEIKPKKSNEEQYREYAERTRNAN